MNVADIRTKLQTNQVTIGSWLQIPNADTAEILGQCGYDWIAVDLEHGGFSRTDLANIFRAITLSKTVPLARISRCHPDEIKQALDAGAHGLIFPMIESEQQLQNGISWTKYPPTGTRGVGFCRANLFGMQFDNYKKEVAPAPLIIAQIEHINGVENLASILQVEGFDAIIVGPYDLSGSMGLTAEFKHPDFIAIMEKIRRAAHDNNVPMGMHIVEPDPMVLQAKIKQGYQFIAYGIDAVFLYKAAQKPII